MKKLFLAMLLFGATLTSHAETPLWLRDCSISLDGQTIAFCYKGDIYTVPVGGGSARAITTNPSYDYRPIWSPDSKNIAFASNREGGFDVYIVSAEGGAPKRLTTHSGGETPITFVDNNTVLFASYMTPDVASSQFPTGTFSQVYKVDTKGSRPEMYSTIPMQSISINGNKTLYNDIKGYEDPWRKHHTSSITRDIWLVDNGKHTKITTFKGEDRNPVWADAKSFYYLSEQDGTFNVYKGTLDGKSQQITKHTKNPVRYLSASKNGTLCYSYDGEIYTVKEGGRSSKVAINIVADQLERDVISYNLASGASDMAVSPSGNEVAFILRGEVFVTSVEYGTTKRITNTAEQERNIEFSPDGRSLIYSSERDGVWNIYQSTLAKKDEKQFTYATEITEKPLTASKIASFQPKYSPSGKSIAYLEDRTTLKVLDLATNKSKTILDGKFNYSYSDGDMSFEWSPDSKYILTKYAGVGGWNSPDVALIEVENGKLTNLTESGYSDMIVDWALDGKAMMWASDRAGMRSHGSWGSTRDIYIMFFDAEAYDKFRMTKEELSLVPPKDPKDTTKKELVLDLESRRDRIMRLTGNSSSISGAVLSKDGTKLYYMTSFEGMPDLWVRDFKDGSTRILVKGAGYGKLIQDKEGKNIFMVGSGSLKKIEIASGKVTPISFSAQFDLKPAAERNYIFNHTWQQVLDKFYVKDLHGADWKGYHATYSKFLPHISNGFDFAEMLSEMLGELNGSHTGARYGMASNVLQTAELGAFFDNSYKGDGLKIVEIPVGSPMIKAGSKIAVGDIVSKVDGVEIKAGEDYFPLLAGKAGKMVELTMTNPSTKATYVEMIKPISMGMFNELLYKRWVESRRAAVEKLSGGKIGYVHIRGMNSDSFRVVYSDLLGRYRNCDAVVIDTRHNGGGWLHDDLATLLSGKEYQRFTPRGNYIGSDPYNKWTKPSIVIQCENNYSNAHGFPWLYKELGIGKLVGAPVPGTMTAVWWEGQIDGATTIGIPEVAVQDMRGKYLENQELMPDIEVYNTPESTIKGVDTQLEVAVRELMKK